MNLGRLSRVIRIPNAERAFSLLNSAIGMIERESDEVFQFAIAARDAIARYPDPHPHQRE